MTDSESSKPHVISVRVMRLIDPLPTRTNSPLVNLKDRFTEAPVWEREGTPCGIGAFTVLPSSFGAVYASEVFRSLVSLFNRTFSPAKVTSLTVDMQKPSMQSTSLLKVDESFVLKSRCSVNKTVRFSLREIGMHMLTCAVTYEDAGTSRTMRQLFRFNVQPPNAPKQTASLMSQSLYEQQHPISFNVANSQSLVELRITNSSTTPVYVLDTKFTPRAPLQVFTLSRKEIPSGEQNTTEDSKIPIATECRHATINKGEICTVTFLANSDRTAETTTADRSGSTTDLEDGSSGKPEGDRSSSYAVTGTPSSSPPLTALRESNVLMQRDLGQVTISWRSTLGEVGHLRSTMMIPETRQYRSIIEVCICSVPCQVYVHQTFTARCQVRNNSDKTVRLYLQIRRDLVGDIVPVGVSGISLGPVLPGCKASCAVPMIPLARGLHSLSGVRVIDVESNVTYKARAASVAVL